MTLSEKDGKLFYELWFPLLGYVNEKCKVNKRVKNITNIKSLNPKEIKEIANVLWENVTFIDRYVEERGENLSEDHKEIIVGWKRRVQGNFIMERHLKKGTIFISEDEKVYQVSEIISSWEEMYFGVSLPLFMKATFIPFRDVIISDGLVIRYNITIGTNMKKQFQDVYMNAKKNGMVTRSL